MRSGQISYAFANAWERAEHRLELLEAMQDPPSRSRTEALGIDRGWRCLDAGAGHGSYARWLAARVGDEGAVVAVDADTRLLAGLAAPNLEVREADLTRDVLERDAYDLVHTRMVLMHIPERDAVLERLLAAVRPGGRVLLEEMQTFSVEANPDGAFRAGWGLFDAGFRAAGVVPEWIGGVPARLAAAGWEDVAAEVGVSYFRGGSRDAEFWSLSWLQMRERIVTAGGSADVLDRGLAALADPALWFYGPAMTAVSARRPGP